MIIWSTGSSRNGRLQPIWLGATGRLHRLHHPRCSKCPCKPVLAGATQPQPPLARPLTALRAAVLRSEIEGMMAIVVRGDALVVSDVEAAFAEIEEVDAVVSTIGGTPADARADSEVCLSVLGINPAHSNCQLFDGCGS